MGRKLVYASAVSVSITFKLQHNNNSSLHARIERCIYTYTTPSLHPAFFLKNIGLYINIEMQAYIRPFRVLPYNTAELDYFRPF